MKFGVLVFGPPFPSPVRRVNANLYVQIEVHATGCGFTPALHRIDNETSDDLFAAIKEQGLTHKLALPGNHHRNPVERATQTIRVDDNCPPGAWDCLVPQTDVTLNVLRPCTMNEAHSACLFIHGPHDFNACPLAPLGCRTVVH